jgi:bifunctional DNA-binding transcriptional regulator/antitoxin component of YhaV-PrlF toxin-antitoxin module
MTTVTLGARYQIVLPRKEREKLRLRPHAKLRVEARDGGLFILPPETHTGRGIGRNLSNHGDPASYIKKLRAEWASRE